MVSSKDRKKITKMTNKGHYNSIVRKAEALNNQLRKLQEKATALIDEIQEHADEYDYEDYEYFLRNLEETLDDLYNFDLEDSIPEKHTVNY